MNLEDLLEARLAGNAPDVPAEIREEYDRAVRAYEAIQFALGETVIAPEGAADRPPPTLPGDYEIVRELGRGGMGVVYLARQKSLARLVAVKVLRPGEQTFGPLVQRFVEEARHLARLRHPNIVSIYEIGEAGGEPYFTMDYVEGESLSAILGRGHLPPTRALSILRPVAEAVQHAHEQGIIHRDLKPGNILVDPQGRAFVTDFGLARDMTQTSTATRSGELMGTPAYMAPEQALGQRDRIGEATDVHALGVILYEMLTGLTPYGADAAAKVLARLLYEEPIPPRKVDRRIPRALETVCLKAMAKEADRRYPTVKAFLEDLRRYESGESILAKRPGVGFHAARIARRYWKIAAVALVAAGLAIFGASRYLDKSAEDLIALAEEQHAEGEHLAAVRAYRKALPKVSRAERGELIGRMLRCCREIGNVDEAIEACLLVAQESPDASFGEYDYLVAQAILTQIRSREPGRTIRYVSNAQRPLLELAARRLRIFLDGAHGSEQQRIDANQALLLVTTELERQRQAARTPAWPPPDPVALPQGSVEELLAQAADGTKPAWDRGKAAMAAAGLLESTGDHTRALEAYRRAFDLLTSVYPIYAGVYGPRVGAHELAAGQLPSECRLLRQAADAIRRLDPGAPDSLQGGIRFRFVGLEIPLGGTAYFTVKLTAPGATPMDDPARFSLYVPVQEDETAWIGVVDGRYRLEVSGRGSSAAGSYDAVAWEAFNRRWSRALRSPRLPSEVEIHGQTLEITARVAAVELELPEGTPDELRARAEDESLKDWERGLAAFAAGQALEESGDPEGALEAYRCAWEVIRPVYPVYSGFRDTSIAFPQPGDVPPECRLVQEVFRSVQRLDPSVPDALRGGIRYRIVGVELPEGVTTELRIQLWDAPVDYNWPYQLPHEVRPRPDQTFELGVADGRYRHRVELGGTSWNQSTYRFMRLLALDLQELPGEVEIRGGWIEIEIPARLVDEIALLEPDRGAAVDLRRDFFRWREVPGAASYNLSFGTIQNEQSGSGTEWRTAHSSSAELCLASLPASDIRWLTETLRAGVTAFWTVEAADESGRVLARSVEKDRPFLVGRGLEER